MPEPAANTANTVLFEYQIAHNLSISVVNGEIIFNEPQQNIFITRLAVKPAMEIDKVDMLAHYPQGTHKAIQDAVGKIVNIAAKQTPAREVKTVKTAEDIIKQRATEKSDEKKPADVKKPEGKVNEAEEKQAGDASAMPDMEIQVITDMLDVPTQVTVKDKTLSVVTRPDEMSQFVTFRQSKKIKVLINGKELQPKQEIEFVKRIFPQIEMKVYLK